MHRLLLIALATTALATPALAEERLDFTVKPELAAPTLGIGAMKFAPSFSLERAPDRFFAPFDPARDVTTKGLTLRVYREDHPTLMLIGKLLYKSLDDDDEEEEDLRRRPLGYLSNTEPDAEEYSIGFTIHW